MSKHSYEFITHAKWHPFLPVSISLANSSTALAIKEWNALPEELVLTNPDSFRKDIHVYLIFSVADDFMFYCFLCNLHLSLLHISSLYLFFFLFLSTLITFLEVYFSYVHFVWFTSFVLYLKHCFCYYSVVLVFCRCFLIH